MDMVSLGTCVVCGLGDITDPLVADEDIPETARVAPKGSDEEESPKKPKKAVKKVKAEADEDVGEEKPKKARKSVEKAKPKPKVSFPPILST